MSLYAFFVRLLSILDSRTKIQLVGLFGLMFVAAAFELAGIGIVFGLLTALAVGDASRLPPVFRDLFSSSSTVQSGGTLALTIFGIVLLYLIKNTVQGFILYGQLSFSMNKQIDLQSRLFALYLAKDTLFHVENNSTTLIRNVSVSVSRVIATGLQAVLQLLMELCVTTVLFCLLIAIDPVATLVAVAVFGSILLIFNLVTRRWLYVLGTRLEISSERMLLWLTQGLDSYKAITIQGRQNYFLDRFDRNGRDQACFNTLQSIVNRLPSLLNEVVLIMTAGIVFVILYSVKQMPLEAIIPILGAFAMAGLRLMPSMSRISSAIGLLHFSAGAMDNVYNELRQDADQRFQRGGRNIALNLEREIRVEDVSFLYPTEKKPALSNINLVIRKGERIALVGPSGSGKTTLADLVLGLLPPSSGRITIDGQDLKNNTAEWWRLVGYVPQSTCIMDDTLRHNILFGVPDSEADQARLAEAIRQARLEDLDASLNRQGARQTVGENGARISGGQKQRIGIARALYDQPEILVLDEATSSLDVETERDIVGTLDALSGQMTQIIIAHRLSTVQSCDRIVLMEQGRISDVGSFEDLKRRNERFRAMTELAALK